MNDEQDKNPNVPIDGPMLMKTCAGAINLTLSGKMTPETCMAVGTAANAYAALQRSEELEERVKRLEQQLMTRASLMSA